MINQNGQEIGCITKELFKFLPKFKVEIYGEDTLLIEKELSFFKSKFSIKSEYIQVEGDWWDKQFNITRNNQAIASINQKWFSFGDAYEMTILEESYEPLIVLLVAAIDYVKSEDDVMAT